MIVFLTAWRSLLYVLVQKTPYPSWFVQEKNAILRWLGVMQNVCDQLYYPLEHIAWAGDVGLWTPARTSTSSWWTASTAMWASSLVISLLTTLLRLAIVNRKLQRRRRRVGPALSEPRLPSTDTSHCHANQDSASHPDSKADELRSLLAQRRQLCLVALSRMSDLVNAVHWLPRGFLWGGRLPNILVGLFGTLSSVIGLTLMVETMKKKQA